MPFKGLKEREKELRRNYIVDAAEKLFFAKSFDSVSMDDIAGEAGLNKATIYQYFKSKEALFFAVALRGFRIENAIIREHLDGAGAGIEKFSAIGNAYFEFTKKFPDYSRVTEYFHFGRFVLEGQDSEDINEIKELRKGILLAIYGSIKAGVEDGTIRSDMNPWELAILLSVFSNSLVDIGPDFKRLLGHIGVDHDKFILDSRTFMRDAIRK